MKIYLLLLLVHSFVFGLSAQESILEDYIQEGIDQNLGIHNVNVEMEQEILKLSIIKGKYLPTISFDASYILSTGGRSIDFPIGDLFNPAYSTLNELTNANSFPTNIENFTERFIPHNFHDTRIRLNYSIFNRSTYYQYKSQEKLIDLQTIKKEDYKQELRRDIKIAYYNYFKIIDILSALEFNQTLLEQTLNFNKKLVKHQEVTDEVVAQIQYKIEKNKAKIIEIEQKRNYAKNYFNTLLGRALDTSIEKDIQIKKEIEKRVVSNTNPQNNIRETNKFELIQLAKNIELNKLEIESNQKKILPTLGAELAAGFQGTGYKFTKDQALATIQFRLNWLLFDGKQRKQKTELLQLESLKLENNYDELEQQINLDIIEKRHKLDASKQTLIVTNAALKSARKNFDLTQKKYKNKQVILLEFLDAQTKYIGAQIDISISEYDLLINQAFYDRAISL